MLSRVRSMGLNGIRGYEVSVECYITNGLPGFEIVGLPDAAVKEARERVRAAVKNCGFRFPVSRITLNLAPAGTKKSGTLYDLPILLGILAASELVRLPKTECAFLGELSLEGSCGRCAACCRWRWRRGSLACRSCTSRQKTRRRPRWPTD